MKSRLQELLKKKGDGVAQQQQKQQAKPTLKLRKSFIPQKIHDDDNHVDFERDEMDIGLDVSKQHQQQQQQQKHLYTKPPLLPSNSKLDISSKPLTLKPPTTIKQQEYQTVRIHRSSSFSSSIHEDEDDNDNNDDDDNFIGEKDVEYIEFKIPQHQELIQLKRSSSFSSSIHEEEDHDDNNDFNNDNVPLSSNHSQQQQQQHLYLNNPLLSTITKQEMYTLLQNDDDLEDFKRINNFTFEGDYLLSKILRERSRIQMKKEMLQSDEVELYVQVFKKKKKKKNNTLMKNFEDDDDNDRKVLFSC